MGVGRLTVNAFDGRHWNHHVRLITPQHLQPFDVLMLINQINK
jgi:hypothetical protein